MPKLDLIVHSAQPLNAEPPLDRLRSAFITRTSDFYIRSHGNIPKIDANSHKVLVTGKVKETLNFSVADLKVHFTPTTLTAAMQCAGNRRADLQRVCLTSGEPWSAGAIGNAEWTGLPLIEILRLAGVEEDHTFHVSFQALDFAENEDTDDAPFSVSIPLLKAMSGDVLLAWAMNGEALKPEHGAPLRIVVPGYAGVRSAKWVGEIRVQDKPSDAIQQKRDYLLFPPHVRKETQDLSKGMPITEMPLNAAICEPQQGATLGKGKTTIRGYAIATDRAIARIDVSINGGRDWKQAAIEDHGNARWSWTFVRLR